jgi:thiamine biosynthesis protein ThiI
MSDRILVRYDEIALKGDNRGWFEKCLASNIQKLVARAQEPPAEVKVHRTHGRILVETAWNPSASEAMGRVFGVSSYSPMKNVPTDYQSLMNACLQEAEAYLLKNGVPSGFCVRTKRSEKALPETSVELDRMMGGAIHEKYPEWKVDLKNPELTIGLEIRNDNSFIWNERIPGHGGLPVGSNAPLLSLMSGGLDSPVAAIQVLRRGSATSFVHFYGTPFVGEEVLQKVTDLVRLVNQYQPIPKPLYVVPFGKIQEKIALLTDPKMRTILYRRMMIRIAERIAYRIKAKGLVTGESLGQVASQTVENMGTINAVATLPILRPLISYTKAEIVKKAHQWKCFEVSVRPGLDCCTLFSDRHPILRSTDLSAKEQEAKFVVDDIVREALDQVQVLHPK